MIVALPLVARSPIPKKHRCPVNDHEYSEVSVRTVTHHIKEAWAWQPTGDRYFFSDDPACEIVSIWAMKVRRFSSHSRERSLDGKRSQATGYRVIPSASPNWITHRTLNR